MEFTVKLVKLFESIFDLMASCFSFLPNWSIVLSISCGAIIIGVVVFKLIRG